MKPKQIPISCILYWMRRNGSYLHLCAHATLVFHMIRAFSILREIAPVSWFKRLCEIALHQVICLTFPSMSPPSALYSFFPLEVSFVKAVGSKLIHSLFLA